MRWKYSCPRCHGHLNPDDTVVLVAENDGRRILMGLHPEPGVYSLYSPEDFQIREGSHWLLRCPLCHADLVSDVSENLAHLDLEAGDEVHRVYFSRVAGERATFIINAEGLMQDYGIHTDHYLENLVHRSFR